MRIANGSGEYKMAPTMAEFPEMSVLDVSSDE